MKNLPSFDEFVNENYSINESKEIPSCKITSYVIIDDDDMLFEQRDNFIKTNYLHGLMKLDADRAIQILKTKIKPIIE